MDSGWLLSVVLALAFSAPEPAIPQTGTPGWITPDGAETQEDRPVLTTAAEPIADPTSGSGSMLDDPGACPNRFWFRADYLLWWLRHAPTSPLLTTGADDGSGVTPGSIGQSNTVILFGDGSLDYGSMSGVRLTGGLWLNADASVGMEVSFIGFERGSTGISVTSDEEGNPIFARPFRNEFSGDQTALLSSLPDELAGSVAIASQSRLFGWEVNGVCRADCSNESAWLVGVRAVDLREGLGIVEAFRPLTTQTIFEGQDFGPPATLTAVDNFRTSNHFYGAQFGRRYVRKGPSWDLEFYGKVALGWTWQRAVIVGATTLVADETATPVTVPGGVLAQVTNTGDRSRDRFGIVPEAGINATYHINARLSCQCGYTFLWWNSVLRAGQQVDPMLADSLIPTSPFLAGTGPTSHPNFQFRDGPFWTQGLNFGVTLEF